MPYNSRLEANEDDMGKGATWRRLQAAWRAFRQPDAEPQAAVSPLDTLLDAVPAVIYARSAPPKSRLTYVSGNVRALLGYEVEEIFATPDFWIDHLHAEDRERCVGTLRWLQQLGQVEMEYRLRAKDGNWRWLHDECRMVRDAGGGIVEIVGSCLDVSSRHRSEQALARSESELRAAQSRLVDALESSDDGFSLFDADDRLIAFNTRYLDIYPSIADLIRPGVRFEDLLRASAQRGQYQGVPAEQVEAWVRERLNKHRNPTGAFEQLLDDGRWLEIVERPTAEGGRVAIRRDITERKRFEATLRAELRFKQTLIDALPYPVYYKNRDGVYLGCNRAFSDALGLPPEQIVGKTIDQLYDSEYADEFRHHDAELLRHGGMQSFETTYRWSDGQQHRMNVVKSTYGDDDNAVAGLIGTIIDITEQKRTQEKLVQTAKLATLGQIASEVAHEMNQPLSILRMTAENGVKRLALGEVAAEALTGKLTVIVEQANRMAEMIARLRSFVRDDDSQRRPFAPTLSVRAALDMLQQQFSLDDITLTVDLPEHCPDLVGQPSQMEQVMLALLSNARDAVCAHRPPGQRRIGVRLETRAEDLVLSVRDNGGGISPELWPRVFTPFFTTKAEDAGTGLGLSASANIVAAMGGRLDGANMDDGAEFRAVWPLSAPAATLPPAPQPASDHRRILVVDDEPLALECLSDYLEARDYRVISAVSPLDALEIARDTDFDLVLTDQRMPGMDGNVLISRLREMRPGLPAIMMSGGTMPLPPASEGPIMRLNKPLMLDELGQALTAVLSPGAAIGDEEEAEVAPPAGTAASPAQRLWLMGELTAHLAHDFGQPINIIRLNAENALDGLIDESSDGRLRRALNSTIAQCQRMQEMARTLVAATRRPTSPSQRFAVLEPLRLALAGIQDKIRMQAIAFVWHAEPHPPPVDGHPHRLQAAFAHLLDNACQALAAEAVARHAEFPPWQAQLKVECATAADGGVVIRIADNGPGLPPAVHALLADGIGKGLGLPIALGVIAEMGGSLNFADGPGTDIRIHLPAARPRLFVRSERELPPLPGNWQRVDSAAVAEMAVLSAEWPRLLSLLAELRRQNPDLPVVVLAELESEQSRQAVTAGAMLVLDPTCSEDDLAAALEECRNGC